MRPGEARQGAAGTVSLVCGGVLSEDLAAFPLRAREQRLPASAQHAAVERGLEPLDAAEFFDVDDEHRRDSHARARPAWSATCAAADEKGTPEHDPWAHAVCAGHLRLCQAVLRRARLGVAARAEARRSARLGGRSTRGGGLLRQALIANAG